MSSRRQLAKNAVTWFKRNLRDKVGMEKLRDITDYNAELKKENERLERELADMTAAKDAKINHLLREVERLKPTEDEAATQSRLSQLAKTVWTQEKQLERLQTRLNVVLSLTFTEDRKAEDWCRPEVALSLMRTIDLMHDQEWLRRSVLLVQGVDKDGGYCGKLVVKMHTLYPRGCSKQTIERLGALVAFYAQIGFEVTVIGNFALRPAEGSPYQEIIEAFIRDTTQMPRKVLKTTATRDDPQIYQLTDTESVAISTEARALWLKAREGEKEVQRQKKHDSQARRYR